MKHFTIHKTGNLSAAVLASALLGLGCAANAQEAPAASAPEKAYEVSYGIGLLSDYRARGIAQTSRGPAIQGSVDLAFTNGIYLGTALSNVKWVKDYNGATRGSTEWDVYGGYAGTFGDSGVSYDIGAIKYFYPKNNSGVGGFYPAGSFTNANTFEVYAAVTYDKYTFKYNRSIGDFLGMLDSSGSQYFDLSAQFDLSNGFYLQPHVGHQRVPNQVDDLGDYTDYSLTLGKDFGNGFSATLSLIGTDAKRSFYTDQYGRYIGNDTVTVGLKYTF